MATEAFPWSRGIAAGTQFDCGHLAAGHHCRDHEIVEIVRIPSRHLRPPEGARFQRPVGVWFVGEIPPQLLGMGLEKLFAAAVLRPPRLV